MERFFLKPLNRSVMCYYATDCLGANAGEFILLLHTKQGACRGTYTARLGFGQHTLLGLAFQEGAALPNIFTSFCLIKISEPVSFAVPLQLPLQAS